MKAGQDENRKLGLTSVQAQSWSWQTEEEEEGGECWLVILFVGHIFEPNKSSQYIKPAFFPWLVWDPVAIIVCVFAFSAKTAFQKGSGNVLH